MNCGRGLPLVLVLALLGCSRRQVEAALDGGTGAIASGGPALHAPTRAEMSLDPGGAPVMKLLDRGRAPRRKLRYTWRTGQAEALTMDLRTSATREDGDAMQPEIQLPPVHVVLAIQPQSVSPEGDLAYAWRVTSTTVAAAPETPSSLAEGMRSEVAAIEHLSGTAGVTSTGLAKGVTFDLASFSDASAKGQMVEQNPADAAGHRSAVPGGRGRQGSAVGEALSARVSRRANHSVRDLHARRARRRRRISRRPARADRAAPALAGLGRPIGRARPHRVHARLGRRQDPVQSLPTRTANEVRGDDDDGRLRPLPDR